MLHSGFLYPTHSIDMYPMYIKIYFRVIFSSLPPAAPIRGMDSEYGSGSGPITLDNVVCPTGNEPDLLSCHHNPVYSHNCQHSEDVAVICESRSIKTVNHVLYSLI